MTDSQPLDPAGPDASAQPPKGALAIIFLIVFMDLLGFGIIIPLLPFYVKDPQTKPFQVTMLFSIYSICQFIGAPILGVISDRVGRRPVLALSQAGSVVGYLLLGFATQFHWANVGTTLILVYVSRVIDGFTGGNISTAQAYVSDVTTPQNRAKGMGLIGAAFGIGFTIGPAMGGILGKVHVSIPAYFAAAFSTAAALITWARLPESREHKPTEAEVWLHPGKFAPIFRKPVLMQLLAISFFLMAAFVMMESTITLFLNKTFGWQQLGSGLYMGFAGVIIACVQGGLIGRLSKKLGDWPLAIAGPLMVGLGMVLLTAVAWKPMVVILLMAGAVNATGRSIYQPTMSSLISKFSGPREQGVVFGLFHGLSSLARVAGPLLAGATYPLLKNTGQFLVAGGIALLMGIWTFALRQPAPADPAAGEAAAKDAVVV